MSQMRHDAWRSIIDKAQSLISLTEPWATHCPPKPPTPCAISISLELSTPPDIMAPLAGLGLPADLFKQLVDAYRVVANNLRSTTQARLRTTLSTMAAMPNQTQADFITLQNKVFVSCEAAYQRATSSMVDSCVESATLKVPGTSRMQSSSKTKPQFNHVSTLPI